MKKTFSLHVEGKHPDRLMDAIKHELNKYAKRERGKALPEGVHFWDFDCKFGPDADSAEALHLNDLNARLDAAALAGAQQVYVEIVAKPGVRQFVARPDTATDGAGDD